MILKLYLNIFKNKYNEFFFIFVNGMFKKCDLKIDVNLWRNKWEVIIKIFIVIRFNFIFKLIMEKYNLLVLLLL